MTTHSGMLASRIPWTDHGVAESDLIEQLTQLDLKSVSCRQCVYESCFCICSITLCVLIGNLFTFKVIIHCFHCLDSRVKAFKGGEEKNQISVLETIAKALDDWHIWVRNPLIVAYPIPIFLSSLVTEAHFCSVCSVLVKFHYAKLPY